MFSPQISLDSSTDATAETHTPLTPPLMRRPWAVAAGITSLALLPLLVLLVKCFVSGSYTPWGDDALLELDVRDVGRHAILLGPYSRFGFRHPGPLYEYLLAIPYWIRGGTPPGLNLGAGLINMAAISGMATIAWRRGRWLLLIGTLLLVGAFSLQRGMADDFLYRPWNPYVTVLPFGCLLFICWEFSRAQRWALPTALLIGSFLVQSHLGYLPVVTTLILVATALAFRTLRAQWTGDERRPVWRMLSWSVGVMAAAWILPAIETVIHWPGNLAKIASFQFHTAPDQTLRSSAGVIARSFGNFPASALHTQQLNDSTFAHGALLGLPVVLLGIAFGYIAVRYRASDALRFGCLVVTILTVASIALSRVVGPLYEYLTRWVQMGTIATLLFPIVVMTDPVMRNRWKRTQQATLAILAVGLVIVTAINTVHSVQLQWRNEIPEQQIATFANAINASLRGSTAPVIIDGNTPSTFALEVGVAAELRRNGHRVYFEPDYSNDVGARNVVTPSTRGTGIVLGGENDLKRLEDLPGATRLGVEHGIYVYRFEWNAGR
ncbi:MAG: hypothetical protein ACOYN3_02120 [Acidimicrobiia bacterium]